LTPRRQRQLLGAVFFILPLVGVIAFDTHVVGRPYFVGQGDGYQSFFGQGLNWITGEPLKQFHHPAYLWAQIASFFVFFSGLPNQSFSTFQGWGVGLHVSVIVLVALWMGRLAFRLSFSYWQIGVISIVIATMPALILFSRSWAGPYYISGLLSVPICLSIYASIREDVFRPRNLAVSFFFLGLLSGNYLAMAIVFVPLSLAMMIFWVAASAKSLRLESGWPRPPSVAFLVGFCLIAAALCVPTDIIASGLPSGFFLVVMFSLILWVAVSFLMTITRAPVAITSTNSDWQWGAILVVLICFVVFSLSRSIYVSEWYGTVISVGGLMLIGYMVWPAFRHLLFGSLIPFLVGWLVGVNWMLRWWGLSVDKVAFGEDAPLTWSSGRLLETDWVGLMATTPWFLSWLLIPVALAALYGRVPQKAVRIFLFVCITGPALLLLVIWDKVGLTAEVPAVFYFSRYYLFLVPVVVLAYTALLHHVKKSVGIMAGIFLIACAVGGLVRHHTTLQPVITEAKSLEALVSEYLQEDPDNYLVCARTELPEICGVLYGYNNYRSKKSVLELNRESTHDGQVIYSNRCYTSSWWEFIHCTGLVTKARRIMVVFEHVPNEGYGLFTNILWVGQHSKLVAGKVRVDCTGQPFGYLCAKR
tara:strand:+ start:1505 stop:3436 length:1932 start_codon:yes stop_codon:yes gene_type:complete